MEKKNKKAKKQPKRIPENSVDMDKTQKYKIKRKKHPKLKKAIKYIICNNNYSRNCNRKNIWNI